MGLGEPVYRMAFVVRDPARLTGLVAP
jgi:hypothetical protein